MKPIDLLPRPGGSLDRMASTAHHLRTMSLDLSSPAACGLDAARLTRIDDWMRRYVDGGRYPFAATLIARKGAVAWTGHYGLADVKAGVAYTPQSLVRIYSMTKPVTAVALMMLYEQGLIHLDDPVSAFIPSFGDVRVLVPGAARLDQTEPLAAPLTVHNLLTHTAGLTYGFNKDILSDAYLSNRLDFGQRAGGLAETADRLAQQPLLFQPGSRWHYSVASDVVGRIVEVVSGKPLDQFFQDNILGPLGMHDTSFVVPATKAARLGPCYAFDPGGGLPEFPAGFGEGEVNTLSGGGGLVSTGHDYLRFAEMMRRGGALGDVRLLGSRTVQLHDRQPSARLVWTLPRSDPAPGAKPRSPASASGLAWRSTCLRPARCCQPRRVTSRGVAWRRPISGATRQRRCRWCS